MEVVIFDDNKNHRNAIENAVRKVAGENNGIYNIALSTSSFQEIRGYIQKNMIQAIFLLDIVADNKAVGFEIASLAKKASENNFIVFISSYPQLFLDSPFQKINAVSIILKDKKTLLAELRLVLLAIYSIYAKERFYLKETGISLFRIPVSDIYYFEKMKSSRAICVVHKNGYETFNENLETIEKKADTLIRCHKSFVVNITNIRKIDKVEKMIHFENNIQCPFSSHYKKEVLKWLK